MYHPHYRKNSRNVPVLSKKEISAISERYVREFMPQMFEHPQPFDVDTFVEIYLNLQLDYQYLSSDGRYLGMTVFNDTDKVIVFRPEYMRAEYIHADCGTIIIDNTLLDEKDENRYRFTLGHEAGHWIFHKAYFGYNPYQLTFFEMKTPFFQCREINRNYNDALTNNWDDTRWMEWQADNFSAGILMPESAVRILMDSENLHHGKEYQSVLKVSNTFKVSKKAAYLRLCNLGYIHPAQDESVCTQLMFI